jgi:hypothetical protein
VVSKQQCGALCRSNVKALWPEQSKETCLNLRGKISAEQNAGNKTKEVLSNPKQTP